MEIPFDSISASDRYKLLIGSVQPRPIAWVCTKSLSHGLNLAPFSFFTVASVNPAIVAFAPLRQDDSSEKDTILNLKEHHELTLNIVSRDLVEAMSKTSASLPRDQSEIEHAGLSTVPSITIDVPRIEQASVHFECRLHQLVELGDQPLSGTLVLAKILHCSVDDRLYDNGKIDSDGLDAVGRLAGNFYNTTRDRFSLNRP